MVSSQVYATNDCQYFFWKLFLINNQYSSPVYKLQIKSYGYVLITFLYCVLATLQSLRETKRDRYRVIEQCEKRPGVG